MSVEGNASIRPTLIPFYLTAALPLGGEVARLGGEHMAVSAFNVQLCFLNALREVWSSAL